MNNKEKLYLAPEDLFRLGNASSSLISRVRGREVDTIEINGLKNVLANGKGVSLYNKAGLSKVPLSGWVWEININTAFPIGLKLIKDNKPEGHYTLAPVRNMLYSEYIALLEKVAVSCQKVFKKKALI